jgi:hypothetical protein
MNRHYELIPEDGAMSALITCLGFSKPNTGDGIGNTLNKIEEFFKNRFAVGIVDDDKRKPKLFDRYDKIVNEKDFLLLKQKPNSRHFLIVVQPAIESWLLQNADSKEIAHPFPTLDDMKRVTKDPVEVVKNQSFKQFLSQLNNAGAPGFVTMTNWIDELYAKHF